MTVNRTDSVRDTFERALEVILARVFVSGAGPAANAARMLAVAYSGGLDSTVLMHLAHAYASRYGMALHAFHVHHGLSPNAGDWQAHCADQCRRIGVRFDMCSVQLPAKSRESIEQAARNARYAALGMLCRTHGIGLLLTAHHQDDQAETVLLQLLRGSGVAGISGMENANKAAALLGNADLWIGRPLLGLTRAELEQWAGQQGVTWIEDESNADVRYTRNRLRHAVMPALTQSFPGYQQRLARAARHAEAAQRLLDELASEDLQRCGDMDGIALERLHALSAERCSNLLRYWFSAYGVRMPSTAWLEQLRTQIFAAGADAQVRITHPDCEVWRYRGRLLLAPRLDEAVLRAAPVSFRWRGEGELPFPDYHGRLLFETGESGVDAAWLSCQELVLRHRAGGERLKLAANRPTRDLKHHFQFLGVPPWERRRLPLVTVDGQLLFAAGIGLNWAEAPIAEGGVVLRWLGA